MRTRSRLPTAARQTAAVVRQRIRTGGERLWRMEDFADLPSAAVAQALSRLTRYGEVSRLTKGIYYRARQTAFGKSHPNPATIQNLATRRKNVFPSGVTAANLLGFTTQNPSHAEVATSAGSLPRKLIGQGITVHTRRPEAWSKLPDTDVAILDFLRRRGETTELSPDETLTKLLELLSQQGRFEKLLSVASSEPPRVRAMLGALGETLGKPDAALNRLRATLNPLSRFDFGILAALPNAGRWQAKDRRR